MRENLRARFYDVGADLFDGGAGPAMPGWDPSPKQLAALDSPADEFLFGGAAGGGKSELILAAARLRHFRSLVTRRTFTMLKDSLIPRSVERFGTPKHFHRGEMTWRWPDRRVLRFGHLQHDNSAENYLSSEYDLVAPDELTQYSLYQYLQMLHVNRTTREGQHCRMLGCTNPGGLGNDWVMERWAPWLDDSHPKPAAPLELRWFVRIADKDEEVPRNAEITWRGEKLLPTSRTYLPARVTDNPYVQPGYVARLQALPEPLRSQRLNGDWKAGLIEDANQTIPRRWLRAAMNRWRPRSALPIGPPFVGVDVAAGGNDQTVYSPRWDHWWGLLRKYPGAQTPDGTDVVERMMPIIGGGGTAGIDAEGIGLSTLTAAKAAGLGPRVYPVRFGMGTTEFDRSRNLRFRNVRALLYWRTRELLDPDRKLEPGEELPQIPPDPELFTDLTAPKFKVEGNVITIEKKDDIKKRIGRSPDCGDAFVITLFRAGRFDPTRLLSLLEADRAGHPA